MGTIGRFNCRKAKENISLKQTPRSGKKKAARPRSVFQTITSRVKKPLITKFQTNPIWHRVIMPKRTGVLSGSNQSESSKVIDVGSVVAARVKRKVEDLLETSDNGVCSVVTMAQDLSNDEELLEMHEREAISRESGLTVKLLGMMRHQAMVATKSRYVWKNAMEGLEKIPSSRDTKVSSWEEAKESLKQVIRFVEEDGLEAHAPDDIAEKYGKKMDSEMDQMKDDLRNMNLSGREKWQTVSSFFDVNTDEGLEVWAAQTKADLHFNARIKDAEERDQRYRQSEAVKELEERQKLKEAQERARSLMRPFTGEEQQIIRTAIYGHGPEDEIIAQCGSDSVLRRSMQTLQPGQWLNDEVIHYFYLMLANRDAERSKLDPSTKRSHFFKSFFMTKLLNEGNVTRDGEYEYSNVKRWSKKVPGKDIFALDKIIFPINMGQMHWICAVIFMAKKKIQIFDSLGSSGQIYLEALFRYLQDEHVDKKKKPLPDQDQWELIPTTSDTPRQRNGFDCGVFTCMVADFISKDTPLVFRQEHINQCRERIALSIMNGKAIM